MMSGKTKVFNFIKMGVESLKSAAPGYFHECPYVGLHSITNLTALTQYLIIAPTGTFRGKLSVTDGQNLLYGHVVYLTLI
jgi:hypothetical protein